MPNCSGTDVFVAVAREGLIVTEPRAPVFGLGGVTEATVAPAGIPVPTTPMPTMMPAVDARFWIVPLLRVVSPLTVAPVVRLPSDKLKMPDEPAVNVIVCTSGVPVVTIWYV